VGNLEDCRIAFPDGRDQRGALLPHINGRIAACDIGAYQSMAALTR
jgi:hypothetical protein